MREIKFRAWDVKLNKMIKPLIGWGERFDNGKTWTEHSNEFNKEDGYLWFPGNLKIMQYTGLKDKNGEGDLEVYEHDIISPDGLIRGNIYEVDARKTDLIIPRMGTKAWGLAHKEAVDRGFDFAE